MFLAVLLSATIAVADLPPTRVSVPAGIRSGFVSVEPGPKPGSKYVVIPNVTIPNTSPVSTAAWKKDDFSLVADDKHYHPVVRPGFGAVDVARDGVLGPHQALKGNLVFVVPDDVTSAKLEFFPYAWYDATGIPMKFCCLPYP